MRTTYQISIKRANNQIIINIIDLQDLKKI